MSHPAPMRRPPDPSRCVNGPIHVPSPMSGAPTIHAFSLYALGGSDADTGSEDIGLPVGAHLVDYLRESLFDADLRLPAENFAGATDVSGPAGHDHFTRPELGLGVRADRFDQESRQLRDRRLDARPDIAYMTCGFAIESACKGTGDIVHVDEIHRL